MLHSCGRLVISRTLGLIDPPCETSIGKQLIELRKKGLSFGEGGHLKGY